MWAAIVVLMVLGIVLQGVSVQGVVEGFENKEGKSILVEDPWDEFQSSFQDALFHTPDVVSQIRASIREIAVDGWDKNELKFLDAGCGTAPNACWFREANIPQVGVDNSEAMLNRARMNCPGAEFTKGDIRQASIFGPKSFSHVLMLNQVVQGFPNAKILADNAAYWLKPDGLCVVHMVHPNRFNPVLDLASPFAGFSIQKQTTDRLVDSEIYFDSFKYKSSFVKKEGEDDAQWKETITFQDPDKSGGIKYREQTQKLTMPSMERLFDIFKASGFRVREVIDLIQCGKEQEQLVYFQK